RPRPLGRQRPGRSAAPGDHKAKLRLKPPQSLRDSSPKGGAFEAANPPPARSAIRGRWISSEAKKDGGGSIAAFLKPRCAPWSDPAEPPPARRRGRSGCWGQAERRSPCAAWRRS